MSLKFMDRWRESAVSILVLIVPMAVFWFGGHGRGGRVGSDGGAVGRFDFAAMLDGRPDFQDSGAIDGECEDPEYVETEHPEVLTMPSYVELDESINGLFDARNNLTRLAIVGDEIRILEAAEAYRKAVEEVQEGIARLQERVDPDAFFAVFEYLLWSHNSDEAWALTPSELGPFAEEVGQ